MATGFEPVSEPLSIFTVTLVGRDQFFVGLLRRLSIAIMWTSPPVDLSATCFHYGRVRRIRSVIQRFRSQRWIVVSYYIVVTRYVCRRRIPSGGREDKKLFLNPFAFFLCMCVCVFFRQEIIHLGISSDKDLTLDNNNCLLRLIYRTRTVPTF